ncbi:hypothetical protein KR054_001513 [Drosophila jambulina]|nr:hypothetical protein KR054_001513 [Drosophila jambulina]
MGSRIYLRTLLHILISSLILAKGHLKNPLNIREWDKQLDKDINTLFRVVDDINRFMACYSIILYAGNFDLRPPLEQRLMEHFSVPIYTVGVKKGPLNHRYPKANNMILALFSGLDDSTLAALNDTELSDSIHFLSFLYVPSREDNRLLAMSEMREFFSWCYEREFLSFRGESELETWSYYYLTNLTVTRLTEAVSIEDVIRRQGHRFLVQAANDLPAIFLHHTAEQADVIGGGNISLAGHVGILIVEFMRYLNASMDILPIKEKQNANYDIPTVYSQNVDLVANLVNNDSFAFNPILASSQMCLLVPRLRMVPFSRYFDMVLAWGSHVVTFVAIIIVGLIKYMAHRRRSLVDSFLSSLRFSLAIPLPGGQLARLPLADKILEVYCFLFVGILITTFCSLLSSVLTTGIYYPPIRDVKSMRASGLRIMATDYVSVQNFKDDQMLNPLADLVDIVDEQIVVKNFLELNDSYAYIVMTQNWQGLQLYEERMENKRFAVTGKKLCSKARYLRLPIPLKSPLRFIFKKYFRKVLDSGVQKKWMRTGFQQFRKFVGNSKLPRDTQNEFKPLPLSFYTHFIHIYIGGMLLSTLVFVAEILYKRYHD